MLLGGRLLRGQFWDMWFEQVGGFLLLVYLFSFFSVFLALLITLLAWFTGCYCIFWGVWYHRRVHEYGYVVGMAGWLRTDRSIDGRSGGLAGGCGGLEGREREGKWRIIKDNTRFFSFFLFLFFPPLTINFSILCFFIGGGEWII